MIKYILMLFCFASCMASISEKRVDILPKLYIAQIDSAKHLMQAGDIIFRGGTDIESAVIREFSKTDKMFSHSGILLFDKGSLKVHHILGGKDNSKGSIIIEPLDSFVVYPQNENMGIYRPSLSTSEIRIIKIFIDSLKSKNVIFDIKFDNKSKDKLYCTELLADALVYATKNKLQFDETSFYVKNTKYHFLINNKDSFTFFPIDQFQHSKYFTKVITFDFPQQGHE